MTTYTGVNAAFREYATPQEVAAVAMQRMLTRQGLRRLAIARGEARVGDYVKGVQYAFANGRFLKDGHKAVEGRVVHRNEHGRLTIERGDGTRFIVMANDEATRGLSPGSIKRHTPERIAKAKAIRAARNS